MDDTMDVTPSFKSIVEQLIATHVQETNDFKRVIAEMEAVSAQNLEKWKIKKESLRAEILKLKQDKQELRYMQKKAQVLLDKYRTQLRNAHQLQDSNTTDESTEGQTDEPIAAKDTNILIEVEPVPSISNPHDCFIFIPTSSTETTNSSKKEKQADNHKQEAPKSKKDSESAPKSTDTPKAKKLTPVRKGDAIDLCDDTPAPLTDSTDNKTTTDDTSPSTKPTKTKYNKYTFPSTKPSSDTKTPRSKSPPHTPKPKSPTTSANSTPEDEDFYQKIYDQYSKSGKRVADDLDFDASSPPQNKLAQSPMPPPNAQPKKFKFVEVVRNKEDRAALPAHECDQCRKFYEAVGEGYDRNKIVQHCSRHRAQDKEPETPPDYWQMSFPSSETQDL